MKVKTALALILILLCGGVCAGGSYLMINNAKKDIAQKEAEMPESALSMYLQQVKNNDFDGAYEISQQIDPHLNSKEAYVAEMQKIYENVDVNNVVFNQNADGNYDIYQDYNYISTVKLIKSNDGTWMASTLFSGDNSYKIEVPAGERLLANGQDVSSYKIASDVVASNFSGMSDKSSAPKVDIYELDNLLEMPTFTVEGKDYGLIKDVLSENNYYMGTKSTNADLMGVYTKCATTLASYASNDNSWGAVDVELDHGTNFYDRLRTMDTQWYTTHHIAQFSNVPCGEIIQQSDDTMIANVTFDYFVAQGSTYERDYHGGFQITFMNKGGSWKIEGFGIDNEM